ncbi:MAG: hypothetical protein ABIP17_17460 [Ilumatobacteraceae bacterium]
MSRRIGVLRPDRPLPVIAEAEARVIEQELERRLGDVTVDLRVDGESIGRWLPVANAAWPTDVDLVISTAALWGDDVPPLTAAFGRTVEPAAATVRRRMLRHLDLMPEPPFALDAPLLDALVDRRVRPTDLWLVAEAASSIDVDVPAVRALVEPEGAARIDRAFDDAVGDLAPPTDDTLARLVAERDAARSQAREQASEVARTRAELADRLDALEAENDVLRERLDRAALQRALDE